MVASAAALVVGGGLFLAGYKAGRAAVVRSSSANQTGLAQTRRAPPAPPPPVTPSAPAGSEAAAQEPATQRPPPEPREIAVETRAPSGKFGIQLGAFPDEAAAREFVSSELSELSLPIHLIAIELRKKKGTWYRVRVGVFEKKRGAKKALDALPQELSSGGMVVRYR